MKTLLMSCALAAGLLSMASAASAATVANESFETPGTFTGGFQTISAGGTIDAWTVDSGSVDLIYGYWDAQNGRYSIDMSGNTAGSISQTISDLIIGQSYRLAFYMAGNPDGGPTVKTLNASINGASGDFTFDKTGKSTTNMGYVRKFLDFKATSTSALLSFTSKDAGAYGAALDNVSISEIPVPASAPLLLAGLGGLAMLRRRRRG
jgi:choice-of-anchor C domain-containing protein